MKCKNCKTNISFCSYFIESLNIFTLGRHLCSNCGELYHVKSKICVYYVLSIGIGRICKYLFIMINNIYDYTAMVKILLVRIFFIYACYIAEQLLFWKGHKETKE